jgi:acyl-CoA synthetase (AMP-forming)/AMP-acid ligase II
LIALTPVQFLERAAVSFGDRVAASDRGVSITYREMWDRCTGFAGALREREVVSGDRVAVLAPNSIPLLEMHYGVPLAGAALVPINARLSAREIAGIIEHCTPRLLLYDDRLGHLASEALALLATPPVAIRVGGPDDEYAGLVICAQASVNWPSDESSLISINYTSGTTGRAKGVMYSHRGAFLQSLAMAFHARLDLATVFLWTLPMFHCNGWCFTWAVTAAGGRHVCLERPEPGNTWMHIEREGVTHFNCAPTVLADLVYSEAARPISSGRRISVAVGGAPPSPTLLAKAEKLGFDITHLYGLTETYGPAVVCEWQPEWNSLPDAQQAVIRARQGIANAVTTSVRVVNREGIEVPSDGRTVGEIAISGNNVMQGYYRDADATSAAIRNGWFHTGDLGIRHPDGYVELTDRAKDVIVSGGENIASVEVERVIVSHPRVAEAAVVGAPHPRWGEAVVAFVTLRHGAQLGGEELMHFVREQLANYKVPKRVVFGPLPKTSTGKVQKHALRERVRDIWTDSLTSG